MWGDHSLGNNLSLLDGDKEQDRVIVFCLGRSAGACSGGIYVVPSYERHYDGPNYAEYVKSAFADARWVIAKTIRVKENRENYWIINKAFDFKKADCANISCDSALKSYVQGPFDRNNFEKKKKS